MAQTISNVGFSTGEDATVITTSNAGSTSASLDDPSTAQLDTSIKEFLGAPHVMAVLVGPEQGNQSAACGGIGGGMYDDTARFGIREQHGSRVEGAPLISGGQDGTANAAPSLPPREMQNTNGEMATPTNRIHHRWFVLSAPRTNVPAVGFIRFGRWE